MKKKLSSRELGLLIFLILLVLGLCYYKFLYQPITEKISSVEADTASEQVLVDQYTISSAKMDRMQATVDEVKGSGQGTPIPEYDNSTELMKELYAILGTTEQYTLTFGSVNFPEEGYIVDRPVQMTFQSRCYEDARAVLDSIEGSRFVNQISDLTILFPTAYDGNDVLCSVMGYGRDSWFGDNVTVNLSVTFYELSDE